MSLFSWKKVPVETPADVTLSDEKKAEIDAVVRSWGEVTRAGRVSTYDASEPPLQVVSPEEVAYLVHAMEQEIAAIEAEADELQRTRLTEIAEKDAQISALKRQRDTQIETLTNRIAAQQGEIERRAELRANLLELVAKIDPGLDARAIGNDTEIRREVLRRKYGDEAVTGKDAFYVNARFDILVEDMHFHGDPFARVMRDGVVQTGDPRQARDEAWRLSVEDLTNAWKH